MSECNIFFHSLLHCDQDEVNFYHTKSIVLTQIPDHRNGLHNFKTLSVIFFVPCSVCLEPNQGFYFIKSFIKQLPVSIQCSDILFISAQQVLGSACWVLLTDISMIFGVGG